MPRKKGSKNKVMSEPTEKAVEVQVVEVTTRIDPNELLAKLLQENDLQITFDAMDGFVATDSGLQKLEKPQLVVKASYVSNH